MKIIYLESVDSTQHYLKQLIRTKKITESYAVSAETQTNGIGSRNNSWYGLKGNLFLSFSVPLDILPKDLKLESASIYFSYILKDTLAQLGSKVWLKWPNDFYINDKKIGGMITNVNDGFLICGVGINLLKAPENFGVLDIVISKKDFLERYFANIEKKVLWKQVFSKYKLEFSRNKNFFTHSDGLRVSLAETNLEEDGSISINGERIYSLR